MPAISVVMFLLVPVLAALFLDFQAFVLCSIVCCLALGTGVLTEEDAATRCDPAPMRRDRSRADGPARGLPANASR